MTAADTRRHIEYKRDGERTLPPDIAARMLVLLAADPAAEYHQLYPLAAWPAATVLYHTAPVEAHAAILTGGLRPAQPGAGGSGAVAEIERGQAAGVYLTLTPDLRGRWARAARWDVWRVDVTDLQLSPDRLNPECFSTADGVPPSRLTWVAERNLRDC